MNFNNLTGKIVFIVLLALVVILSQVYILKPHLMYGFSDVDWGFLSFYKTQNPYSISQLIKNIEIGGTLGGVYTHQIYYIGMQHEFFGLNYQAFQQTTHVFKTLAIIIFFPVFLIISGSWLVAAVATILFAFSASAVGTMYTVVTSSDYSAIFSAGIFLIFYWYVVKNNIKHVLVLFFLLVLLILTLFLSTERMYQLPVYIGIVEAFLFWQKKKLDMILLRRTAILFVPLILVFLFKPMVFLSYFLSHGEEIVTGLLDGNWNLLLTPFIALGSIILPHDFTKYFGVANLDSFGSFIDFIISGPLVVITFVTVIIGTLVFKKSRVAILHILIITVGFSILLYILGSNFKDHQISKPAIIQALVGFYTLAVASAAFLSWLKSGDRSMIAVYLGPFFAFIYIVFTWVGAATAEVFSGVHRYLTIPALLMDFFIAVLFVSAFTKIYTRLRRWRIIKFLAFIVFIPLLFYINVNIQQINAFFNYQLQSGFSAADKNLMRGQLNSYLTKLSNDKPSLFYFDFAEDQIGGYYYDNALLAGFESWMLWHPSINFNKDIAPKAFWNNFTLLQKSVYTKDGMVKIRFNDREYELDNFYAFKVKDKKLVDIKQEILMELGIN